MYLKLNNMIGAIKSCKDTMNANLYRKMLAKAYVLLYAQIHDNKNEIMYLVNRELEKENVQHISYMFITTTLKG